MECTACGFVCQADEMFILHQAICAELPAEKREFRLSVAKLMFDEYLPQALDLAAQMTGKQGKSVILPESLCPEVTQT